MKRICSFFFSIVILFSGITVNGIIIKADDSATWKKQAITAPEEGKLIGAGYIDIKLNNNLDDVDTYTVYADGKAIKTLNKTSAETMSTEMYTTSVSAHTTYIVAKLNDGSTVQTNTRTFYVTKKGIGVNTKDMGEAVDPADMNLGWYYSWGTKSFKELKYKNTKFYDLEFVPMIYGEPIEEYSVIMNRANEQGYKYLLGFNEPDLRDESNISPNIAASRWINYFVPNKGNLRLTSPAISTASPLMESDWWSSYWSTMSSSDKAQTDVIAIHRYYNNYSSETAKEFLMLIDETYDIYKKPIWVTEFALWIKNDPNMKEAKKAQEFLTTICKGLDERSYVERYAWFVPDINGTEASSSALFDYETGTLTEIGKMYAQIGNPSGYNAKTYGVNSKSSVDTSVAGCLKGIKSVLFDATGKKKAFSYTAKTVKRAKGYQIQYGTKKNMKGAKTKTVKKPSGKISIKFTKAQKKQIKKKKVKKFTYFIRVRAYKNILGKKVYYGWSDKIKVQIKTK